ncbi:uncharacterized protein LOC9644822 isoform X1 [Selaginella moellendorffii]|uniref:uncharacterized protein LOC9644822 isoform X1 n=1 Tax=Selaginella moellendorffii TaxID=88036 RepID=UPI000D1C84B3|nr:uncharacterized protein LOC9644822 isoform X1 [Selaginella moellendorffii]|eukprot:XP_024521415.1 uncharacterized protein LOC9644822 isoform X1 [Selaginella moellendorffii]
MEHCVLTCSSSFHAIEAQPRLCGRARTQKRSVTRQFFLLPPARCLPADQESFGFFDEERFPQLSPKPKPIPVPEGKHQQQQEEVDQSRILSFLENFPDKPDTRPGSSDQVPDPSSDNFRDEMRRRLLYSEPPPLPDPDEDRSEEDIEFDMFEHLVLTIRHILHLRYNIGERLGNEDELILLEEAIPYHPEREIKVGCGISYIKVCKHMLYFSPQVFAFSFVSYQVDVHPEFGSRCFFIVRQDQSEIDFSYRKCMMGHAQAKEDISVERARDLVYFFKNSRGQQGRPHYYSLT